MFGLTFNRPRSCFKILQWNCRSLKENIEELSRYTAKTKPEIIALQEYRISTPSSHKPSKLIGYDYPPIEHPNLRIAFFIRSDVTVKDFDTINTNFITSLGIQVSLQDQQHIKIINYYTNNKENYHDKRINTDTLVSMFESADLVLGDFNAHSPLWCLNTRESDRAGRILEQAIDRSNKVLLNNRFPTHINENNDVTPFNALDLTFCNPKLFLETQWDIHDDTLGSDHFPILISINEICSEDPPPGQGMNISTKNTNWDMFHLLTASCEVDDSLSLDEQTQQISDIIIQAVKDSSPIQSKKSPRVGKTWWTDECQQVISKRNRFLKIWRHSKTGETKDQFKLAKSEAKKVIKNAKREDWKKFTSTLNCKSKASYTWKKLKQIAKGPQSTTPTLKTQYKTATSDKEKADMLADQYFKVSSNDNLTTDDLQRRCQLERDGETRYPLHESDPHQLNNEISTMEILLSIRHKSKGTAPGPDHITYEMIKKCHPNLKSEITKLFNKLLQTGHFPSQWKKAVVVPILKPNKPRKEPSSYRPISLTSQLGKTFESVLKNRLNYFVETKHIIPANQSGFRKKRSTLDHLTVLQQKIINHISDPNFSLIGIFLDIEKAYDMLWRQGLLMKLRKHKIPQGIYNVLKSFLSNRSIQVKVKNTLSKEVVLENGVPQGSILSPLLFNIMMSEINSAITHKTTSLMQFADDTSLLGTIYEKTSAHKHRSLLGFHNLQNDLTQIASHLQSLGFKISTHKTQVILFRNNRNKKFHKDEYPNLVLFGQQLDYQTKVKFLGVIFQENGELNSYIDYICTKSRQGLKLLRCISAMEWGADPETLLMVYHAHVLSKVLYAAPLFAKLHKYQLDRLQIIQNSALKTVLGVSKNTPNISVLAETAQQPIETIIKNRTACFYFKQQAFFGPNPTREIICTQAKQTFGRPLPLNPIKSLVESTLQTGNIQFMTVDGPDDDLDFIPTLEIVTSNFDPPWTFLLPSIDKTLTKFNKETNPHLIRSAFYERLQEHYHDFTTAYTDGSHEPQTGCTGAGVYSSKMPLTAASLPQYTSVFTAELTAIIMALHSIQEHSSSHQQNKYLIVTDSLSSIQAIEGGESSRPDLVGVILKKTTELIKSDVNITLIWVPSHRFIFGNDMADRLAKKATRLQLLPPPNISLQLDQINDLDAAIKQYQEQDEELNQSQRQELNLVDKCPVSRYIVAISPPEKFSIFRKITKAMWIKDCESKIKMPRKTYDPKPAQNLTIIKAPRSIQSRISRLRLGGERAAWKFKDTNCLCDNKTKLNTKHLLLECPLVDQERQCLKNLISPSSPLQIENILNPTPSHWNRSHTLLAQLVNSHPLQQLF